MAVLPIGGVGAAAPALPATPATPSSPAAGTGKGGFGSLLSNAMDKLDQSQAQAATAAQQLATGQSTNIGSVVSQVEEASLELQLAVQVRDKAVDAYNELFGMSI